jgi:GNAT superfamily N-acetyltransferase
MPIVGGHRGRVVAHDSRLNIKMLSLRTHRPDDIEWIVRRHRELYSLSHGWDERFVAMVEEIAVAFDSDHDPERERSWIAEVDGRRVGSIFLVQHSDDVGQLRLLFVEPQARGLGIGARLVAECVEQARAFGYSGMMLTTVRSLVSARRLYEAEGFRLVEEEQGHEWGGEQMMQTWTLDL